MTDAKEVANGVGEKEINGTHTVEDTGRNGSYAGASGRRRSTVADLNRDRNLDAKISNPLAGIPRDALMADVSFNNVFVACSVLTAT
jgi:hypothetical protein